MSEFSFAGAAECLSVGGSNPLAATIARMMMAEAMPQLAVAQATNVAVQSVTAGGLDRGGAALG